MALNKILIAVSLACYLTAILIFISKLAFLDFFLGGYPALFLFWIHISIGFLWVGLMIIFISEHIIVKKRFLKTLNRQSFSGILQVITVLIISLSGILLFLYYTNETFLLLNIHRYSSIWLILGTVVHVPKLRNIKFFNH
ncbi:MAG: hypothetical protein JJV97_00375 [SAR324 cluster bacterium]|nr:hypothetical protein [SAR324 cluster bacterium]